MFTSLRSRLWLSYALIIVTALSVVAIVLFISLLRNPLLYRQTQERLNAVQTVMLERSDNQPLVSIAEQAARTFNVRVLLYSQDKQLLLDTDSGKAASLPLPEKRPEKRIVARNIPLVRDSNGVAWLYSREQLADKTYLVVAAPRPRISVVNLFTDDFLPLIVQSGLIALALSLFVAFIFSRWIADPLQRVVVAAKAPWLGVPSALATPVDVRGPREVQELMRAFNSMVARVQASQRSQREFVANVSHELKTPLTSIQGFSQAMLDGAADTPEERRQAAQVIYDESARMHRMVLDLLDLARLDSGTADLTMSSVHMPVLLNGVAEKFFPQTQQAGVDIKVKLQENLPILWADGDRLAQVFTNLVDNALKFTPRGGWIRIHASIVNEEMLVSVMDNGAGMTPEVQAHIFDRFYQADPSRKGGGGHGAGLGLAIAHEIVQAHNGRISVRSGLGEGTAFEVFLPLTKK